MILEAIGSWPGAIWLRGSATAYLFVNATHILGIGLLLGSILPLDLRLLGFFRRFPLEVLRSFLVRNAAVGLTLAIVTGLWLFSVKPAEYLANTAFRWKMVFLVIALLNVAFQHRGASGRAFELTRATRVRAALSLCLWLSALVAGRWIGFL
jgi:uncharacterized membrane protein YtjA (UPF0391 family)